VNATHIFAIAFWASAASGALAEGEQKVANIGDLRLSSGKILKRVTVGYRTFGKLDAAADNAVLVPTWFLGKTNDLKGSFQAGGLVDSKKYFVIAVDALSNGVSTSPSNSKVQPGAKFPVITIRDMVESQHRLLTQVLRIHHLKAVLGISMGGMQAFTWLTAYPTFLDCAIPIVGSPKPTSYDRMVYLSGYKAMSTAAANKSARDPLMRAYADSLWMALSSPSYYVRTLKVQDVDKSMIGFEKGILAWNPFDARAGLNALATNNAFRGFGNSESKAAAAVKARVLVISATQDHCVNPTLALSFAKAMGAQTLVLEGDEGHNAPWANMKQVSEAIDRFLENRS
jgi:homoserine O-acetyltransferase